MERRDGAVLFMGDYIDLAPAPPFILNDNGTMGANGMFAVVP